MPIPLPNLDDRRWVDLVDEGRALIPLHAPEWTDHNVHDPGITLMELFAWIAEMDIYQLNCIPERHKQKFLALAGIRSHPPRPARTLLSFAMAGSSALYLPAGVEFSGVNPFGAATRFRTLEPFTVAPPNLIKVQVRDAQGFHDLTERWSKGEPFGIFGVTPQTGAELYLGFDGPLPKGRPVNVAFHLTGLRAGDEQRELLLEEMRARKRACLPPANPCTPTTTSQGPTAAVWAKMPPHHSVRLAWEVQKNPNVWQTLRPEAGEVDDDTRAFTLNGRVRLYVPVAMTKTQAGVVVDELYYLRCRFESGEYDAAPMLEKLVLNGVTAEQATPVAGEWKIRPDAEVTGPAPEAGQLTSLDVQFDAERQITRLAFGQGAESAPRFMVLAYEKSERGTASAKGTAGRLALEAVYLGAGTGGPHRQFALPEMPVQESSFCLFTLEDSRWRTWENRLDFDASSRGDAHFLFDAAGMAVVFGDGEKGRIPSKHALVFATYLSTRAEAGNLADGWITQLADSPHNRAVQSFCAIKSGLARVTNPVPAQGGAPGETLSEASGRAIEMMRTAERAVTLQDYEELARKTPGVQLSRVAARADLHPGFPCLKATGVITVIVVPFLPEAKPVPSLGLLRAVAAHLRRRRIVGTRVEVVGPGYLTVSAVATVRALRGINAAGVQQRIVEALNRFLHPLLGGPDGTGWPFGRNIYRSEILQVIDQVQGVDHVLALDLLADSGPPKCGNLCLPPTWLVTAGQHRIDVV